MPAHRSKFVKCEICDKRFKPAGLVPHRKACARWDQKLQEDLALLKSRKASTGHGSSSNTNTDPVLPSSGPNVPAHIAQDDDHDTGDQSNTTPDARIDDIRIESHPHSGEPAETSLLSDLTREHSPKPMAPGLERDPWHPFRTLLDSEVVEFALEAALNEDQTSRLIKIMQRAYDGREEFTLRSHEELCQTRDTAAFQNEVVSAQYQNEPHPSRFNFWHRRLWDWACGACELLRDPRIGPHCVLNAQRLSKCDGTSFVHFVDEPYTADRFWNAQSDMYTS
ncbi:hypothetical protein PAXINDRAFT_96035 [Paxillus involutus ATCC 200175]|nr:hypothetical protein PAXINDRAFT_96035 [Paxillus involutus ATCC 200175]